MTNTAGRRLVDGYDAATLAECLAARGMFVAADDITGVHNGCVYFGEDSVVWLLPRWIEEAKVDG